MLKKIISSKIDHGNSLTKFRLGGLYFELTGVNYKTFVRIDKMMIFFDKSY